MAHRRLIGVTPAEDPDGAGSTSPRTAADGESLRPCRKALTLSILHGMVAASRISSAWTEQAVREETEPRLTRSVRSRSVPHGQGGRGCEGWGQGRPGGSAWACWEACCSG